MSKPSAADGLPEMQPARAITDAFAWLTGLGFGVIEVDWGGEYVRFADDSVVVNAHYHWKDEHASIAIGRRWHGDGEQPLWSEVQLGEILARRAPGATWNDVPENESNLTDVFRSGSELLREYASDLVAGDNLELLDDIIASHPRVGVPGLDFPADAPWAASSEGLWMFTDLFEIPQPMSTYLERSHSDDPAERAVAALKMVVASRAGDATDREAGHARLHELLSDADADVRRAAGSALGEWPDSDALDELLALLETEAEPTPFASAATFVAFDASKSERERVLEALERFAAKSPAAADQVSELAWRLRR